jgi:EpsD family peptidyl-prolyl cis-trans isomerase
MQISERQRRAHARKRPGAAANTVAVLAAVALAAALGACGGGSSKPASQVAVKVNKDEVTVLQLNEQLARVPPGVPPEQLEAAKRRILDNLVDEQLLVQQSIERKLDRDPEVLGALEAARLNILAQAYVQRVLAPQAKPTEEEIKQYYADNPDLFGERKVYRLQELTVEAASEQARGIAAATEKAKSLKQVADYLQDKKLMFASGSGVRTAEQLPLGVLPRIARLKAGGLLAFESSPNRVSVIEVLASERQPVDEKRAAPVIEQYLANRKREQLAAAEIKRLHDAAKIEYVGEFAKYATAEAPSAAAPASTPAPPAAAAPKPAAGDQDKGIAGPR